MSYLVKQEVFEGPLDLLLQLIEKEELDITAISLATVTDEYLRHVEQLERQNLPEITDWLVIAARLLLLKSRALLEDPDVEDAEAEDLAAQLAEYKLYKGLARQLGDRVGSSETSLGKAPSVVSLPDEVVTDGVSLQTLTTAFSEILTRLPDPGVLRTETLAEQVTIEECIDRVRTRLADGPAKFAELFRGLRSRLAMIVTFLAILELVKQRLLAVGATKDQLTITLRP